MIDARAFACVLLAVIVVVILFFADYLTKKKRQREQIERVTRELQSRAEKRS